MVIVYLYRSIWRNSLKFWKIHEKRAYLEKYTLALSVTLLPCGVVVVCTSAGQYSNNMDFRPTLIYS